jgi:hypothetical protein
VNTLANKKKQTTVEQLSAQEVVVLCFTFDFKDNVVQINALDKESKIFKRFWVHFVIWYR